jgi:hypothetical protein
MLMELCECGMDMVTLCRQRVLAAGRVTDKDIATYAILVRSVRASDAMEATLYARRKRRRRRPAAEPDECLLGDLLGDLAKERGDRPFSKVLAEVSEALARIGREVGSKGGDETVP